MIGLSWFKYFQREQTKQLLSSFGISDDVISYLRDVVYQDEAENAIDPKKEQKIEDICRLLVLLSKAYGGGNIDRDIIIKLVNLGEIERAYYILLLLAQSAPLDDIFSRILSYSRMQNGLVRLVHYFYELIMERGVPLDPEILLKRIKDFIDEALWSQEEAHIKRYIYSRDDLSSIVAKEPAILEQVLNSLKEIFSSDIVQYQYIKKNLSKLLQDWMGTGVGIEEFWTSVGQKTRYDVRTLRSALLEREQQELYDAIRRESKLDVYAVKLARRMVELLPLAREIKDKNGEQVLRYNIAGQEFRLSTNDNTGEGLPAIFGLNNDFWDPVLNWLKYMRIDDISQYDNLGALYEAQRAWHIARQKTLEEDLSTETAIYITNNIEYEFTGKWAGWKIVNISSGGGENNKAIRHDLNVEGYKMNHCIADKYEDVVGGKSEVYSLRDPRNHPHATIELRPSGELVEAAGNSNANLEGEYKEMVSEWLQKKGAFTVLYKEKSVVVNHTITLSSSDDIINKICSELEKVVKENAIIDKDNSLYIMEARKNNEFGIDEYVCADFYGINLSIDVPELEVYITHINIDISEINYYRIAIDVISRIIDHFYRLHVMSNIDKLEINQERLRSFLRAVKESVPTSQWDEIKGMLEEGSANYINMFLFDIGLDLNSASADLNDIRPFVWKAYMMCDLGMYYLYRAGIIAHLQEENFLPQDMSVDDMRASLWLRQVVGRAIVRNYELLKDIIRNDIRSIISL